MATGRDTTRFAGLYQDFHRRDGPAVEIANKQRHELLGQSVNYVDDGTMR